MCAIKKNKNNRPPIPSLQDFTFCRPCDLQENSRKVRKNLVENICERCPTLKFLPHKTDTKLASQPPGRMRTTVCTDPCYSHGPDIKYWYYCHLQPMQWDFRIKSKIETGQDKLIWLNCKHAIGSWDKYTHTHTHPPNEWDWAKWKSRTNTALSFYIPHNLKGPLENEAISWVLWIEKKDMRQPEKQKRESPRTGQPEPDLNKC